MILFYIKSIYQKLKAIMNATTIQYTMTPLKIAQHDWSSLYLKMWAEGVIVDGREIKTNEDLQWLVEDVLYIGRVARIDVKKSRTKSGSIFRSAFIHFHMWDTNYGKFVRESINHKGNFKIDISNKTEEPFQNKTHKGTPYFVFYKNMNPVSETPGDEMNKEQLMARCENLERSLQDKTIEVERFIKDERTRLQDTIDTLRNTMKCYEPYASVDSYGVYQ